MDKQYGSGEENMNPFDRLFRGWRWLQNKKNNRILRIYRNRARRLAKKCPGDAERLLWEIDEVEEMLKL